MTPEIEEQRHLFLLIANRELFTFDPPPERSQMSVTPTTRHVHYKLVVVLSY
jgi:hypothetical protein